jgi:hypothetical protein
VPGIYRERHPEHTVFYMNGIKTHYWQLLSMMDKLTQLANELAITNMKHQIETGTADSKLLDRQLA